MNTGYLYNEDRGVEDLKPSLLVQSCGVYRLLKQTSMVTTRPEGRLDYQLLYVHTGKVEFLIEGKIQSLSAGHLVLYRPKEPQYYRYILEDNPEVYWIHFTGCDVKNLVNEVGFEKKSAIFIGGDPYYAQTFLQMIQELQVRRAYFEEVLALLFRQMLIKVKRHLQEGTQHHIKITKEVEEAIHYFHENYAKNINIEDYAKGIPVSTSWFIRSFRNYTGMAPLQYITSIRMIRAKEFLEGSTYNINQISAMLGYENPLYFSRIFKKQVGVSPFLYRKLR